MLGGRQKICYISKLWLLVDCFPLKKALLFVSLWWKQHMAVKHLGSNRISPPLSPRLLSRWCNVINYSELGTASVSCSQRATMDLVHLAMFSTTEFRNDIAEEISRKMNSSIWVNVKSQTQSLGNQSSPTKGDVCLVREITHSDYVTCNLSVLMCFLNYCYCCGFVEGQQERKEGQQSNVTFSRTQTCSA